jgi:hypothetical protein
MTKTLLDLTPRFRQAFGFAPVLQQVQPLPGGQYVPYTGSAKVYTQGNVSFEDLHINGNGHDLFFGGASLTKSGEMGNVFAPPPMLAWRKSKNLIITAIDGTDNEVVEQWGNGVWEITMQGLLVDMKDHYFPVERMERLRKVFEVKASFAVSAQLFDALDIQSIYFTDIEITPLQGFQDTCVFSLTARGIKPVEFYLNNEAV